MKKNEILGAIVAHNAHILRGINTLCRPGTRKPKNTSPEEEEKEEQVGLFALLTAQTESEAIQEFFSPYSHAFLALASDIATRHSYYLVPQAREVIITALTNFVILSSAINYRRTPS